MSGGVPDARRRRVYAPGDRGGAGNKCRHVEGATLAGPRKAPRRTRDVRGGMGTMKNDMNDDRYDINQGDGLDFGPDADAVPHDAPAFDARTPRPPPTLNAPNTAPRL